MAGYRQELLEVMPETRTVMAPAFGINPDALKSTAHSLADLEFKQRLTHANHVGREIVGRLKAHGVKPVNMPCGFPYEAKAWPAKMWLTNDKVFAVEAGLGRMGWNRLLLHGKLGAAVLLGCVLVGAPCGGYDQPLGFNPCIECGLCVGVCPVGAVRQTDAFDFMASYAHNCRERLGGFQNWVERLADSRDGADYRRRVSDSETISMWQNLSIGAQTHCDRCMAVCPAGEEAIGGYLADRKAYSERTQKRFNRLPESVYVLKGFDAELHARSRFPEKTIRYTSSGIRPSSAGPISASRPTAGPGSVFWPRRKASSLRLRRGRSK
jgi:epoxyqueuosine reductase QueG